MRVLNILFQGALINLIIMQTINMGHSGEDLENSLAIKSPFNDKLFLEFL